MSSVHERQYFLAPYSGSFGTMECAACRKKIEPERQDFRSAKKTCKDEGWRYITHHRVCLQDDVGFIAAENVRAELMQRQNDLLKAAITFRGTWGVCDLDELIEGLSS